MPNQRKSSICSRAKSQEGLLKQMTEAPEASTVLTLFDSRQTVDNRWQLTGKPTFTIGRDPRADIPLLYSWVSRKHAMIQREENGHYHIIDLGSSNGTFLNGRKVHTPVTLQSGDCIGIGNTRLLFTQTADQFRPPAPDSPDLDEMTVAFVQKQTVTILICDIHDYTRLSEIKGDRWISQLLQHWTGGVSKLVEKHKGIVDKFIGDSVMALWSGPDTRDNIHQALKTAYAINFFTSSLNRMVPDIPWPLNTGAALNTGEAILGNLAHYSQHNYTVVGDVVNVAFHLENMTNRQENLDLVLGCDAAAYLSESEPFFEKRFFKIKGKQNPVEAYGCSFAQLSAYLGKLSRAQR